MGSTAPDRDIAVGELGGGLCLVLACDSLSGIGEKECEVVDVSPYVVGRFTCRVAFLEVPAAGAAPLAVSAAIASELVPTGEGILASFQGQLGAAGFDSPWVVSTEKNTPTCRPSWASLWSAPHSGPTCARTPPSRATGFTV